MAGRGVADGRVALVQYVPCDLPANLDAAWGAKSGEVVDAVGQLEAENLGVASVRPRFAKRERLEVRWEMGGDS